MLSIEGWLIKKSLVWDLSALLFGRDFSYRGGTGFADFLE